MQGNIRNKPRKMWSFLLFCPMGTAVPAKGIFFCGKQLYL